MDPVALLHSVRETQSALASIVSPEVRPTPTGESLERLLAKLPDRWRQDEEAALRPAKVRAPHNWRTRKDPFEGVWCDVLGWLQEDPDASAVALLTSCSQLIRTGSKGLTCALCSGGCNNRGVSWRVTWFTPFPVKLHGTNIHCRN